MIALKKRISFLMGFCALIVAIAMVSVGVTMAIWSGSTRETNVVTIGNVKIELIDEYDYPSDDPPEFQPNDNGSISKTVTVKNIGRNKCYVRVLVKIEWTDTTSSDANVVDISPKFIEPQYDTTGKWVKGDPLANYPGFDVYYYQATLDPGSPAKVPLFSEFKFRESYTENGTTYTFDLGTNVGYIGNIRVMAQAVQSEYLGQDNDSFGLQKNSSGQIIGWPNDLVFN